MKRICKRRKKNMPNHRQLNTGVVMVLTLLKLGLRNTNAEQILVRLRYYIFMLAGNADFPVIDPSLPTLQAKAGELKTAMDKAKTGDHLLIEHRNIVKHEAEDLIRALGWDIQKKSGGDKEKIHRAGFSTWKERTPMNLPPQVQNLRAICLGEGKIKLRWNSLKRWKGLVYVIDMCDNPTTGNWKEAGKSFSAAYIAENLVPGQMYYFRVYVLNRKGKGELSEISNQRSL